VSDRQLLQRAPELLRHGYGVEQRVRLGGPEKGTTEYLCFRQCLEDATVAGGGAYDPVEDVEQCAVDCASIADNGSMCDTIGVYTQDVFTCMQDSCEDECIFDPAMAD